MGVCNPRIIESYNFPLTYLCFQEDCYDAIALQLLLKLKRHLKIVYSLTDARCQVWVARYLQISTAMVGAFA